MSMTNDNVRSLVTKMGGEDFVFALIFDNNYIHIFDKDEKFSLSDNLVTIGGKDYVKLYRLIPKKGLGTDTVKVNQYFPTEFLWYMYSVDEKEMLTQMDRAGYDILF